MDALAEQFLQRLNAAIKRKVTVTLIGGNALVALGLKKLTRDVDLVVRSSEPETAKFCQEYASKYKVKVEFFVDGLFKHVRVKDYLEKATTIDAPEFANLIIKILNIYDIILTKTNRFEDKDQKDILNILSQMEISTSDLDKRFKYYLKYFMGPNDEFVENYETLKKAYGHLLKP